MRGGLNEEELENEVQGDHSVNDISVLLPDNDTLPKLTRDPKRHNEVQCSHETLTFGRC
jgi:hypothetical protein